MKTLTKTLLAAAALATAVGGYAVAQGMPGMGGMGGMGGMQGMPGMSGMGGMNGPMMNGPMGGPMHAGKMMGRHGDPAAMVENVFAFLDTNKDGVITLDEAMAKVDARFDEIDANHDGVIDRAEAASWVGRHAPAPMVDRFMAMHDLDGDGKITKAEWEKPFKKRFALYDRNDDGKITKEEALLAMPHKGFGHHRHGGHDGDGHWSRWSQWGTPGQGAWGASGQWGMNGPGMMGFGYGMSWNSDAGQPQGAPQGQEAPKK